MLYENDILNHLTKYDFQYYFYKESSFRDSLCPYLQKCMPQTNHEEYREYLNTKFVSLDATFPTVPRVPQYDSEIKNYRKTTIILSFSLSFLPISLYLFLI